MKKFFTLLLATAAVCAAQAAPMKATVINRAPGAAAPSLRSTTSGLERPPFKSPASDLKSLPLIDELPAGAVSEKYSRNSRFYAMDFYGQLTYQKDFGLISEVATEGEKVFIKNPFAGMETDSYLVGTRSDDRITVELPQKIYSETYVDWFTDETGETMKTDYYYAFKMTYSESDGTSRMKINDQSQTVVFNVTDGSIVMDGDDNDFIGMLLLVEDEESDPDAAYLNWTRFADTDYEFTTVTDTPVTLPEGVQLSSWVLHEKDGQRLIQAGFDGNDFYVGGLLSVQPEMLVKGTLADGKISFPSAQYMGECDYYDHYAYFIPEEYTLNDPEDPENVDYRAIENMVFTWDAENMTLTPDAPYEVFISAIPDGIYWIESTRDPSFSWQDDRTPMVPKTPVIQDYQETFDDYGFNAIAFNIPLESSDGRLMDINRLYYSFLIDGEILTFYPDEDPYLEEPTSVFPYTYEDGCIYFWGDCVEAMIFTTGFNRIGVRAYYRNPDGTETQSEDAYWQTETKVTGLTGDAPDTVGEEFFDLSGRRVAKGYKGIIVKRSILSDGTVKTAKVIVK